MTGAPATAGTAGTAPDDDPIGQADGDLRDLLQELRVLLQGAQVLTAFLVVVPFSEGFRRLTAAERQVYLVLFLCSLTSLVLFSAPAAQHRLLVPLHDRVRFKRLATRLVVVGLVPLTGALVLATHLVVNEVGGGRAANLTSATVAALVLGAWWAMPLWLRWRRQPSAGAAAPPRPHGRGAGAGAGQ